MLLPNKGQLVLGLTFAMVSVADVVTTLIAIKNGAQEMNPIVNTIIHIPIALIGLKCVGILLIIGLVNWLPKLDTENKFPNLAYFTLALITGVTLGAVINNALALKSVGMI